MGSSVSNALLVAFIGPLIICLYLLTVSVMRKKKTVDNDSNVTFQGNGNYKVVQL